MASGTTAVGSTSEKKEAVEEVRHSSPLDRTFGRSTYVWRVLVVRSNARRESDLQLVQEVAGTAVLPNHNLDFQIR